MMNDAVKIVWSFFVDHGKGYGLIPHHHDYFQMYYVLSGAGTVLVEQRPYYLETGSCLILYPNQIHELLPLKSGHIRIADTKFYIVDPVLREEILSLPNLARIRSNDFFDLQQNLRNEWALDIPHSQDMAALLLMQILIYYVRLFKDVSPHFPSYHRITEQVRNLQGVERWVADYVESHYLEDFSLDDLASALRYSKSYLCRRFKSATKITINEYTNFLRINRAYDMVRYSDQHISEISALCCFSSIHYFSRTFRKITGMSPSEARNKDRNSLYADALRYGKFHHRYYVDEDGDER